jgi:hypothetical protein
MPKRYQRVVLSVLFWFMDSYYPFGIFWPLSCLFFFDLRILITPLVFFGHCVGTDNTMAKRYQRGNQNPYIEEEQTTQWPKDTKGVIRIRKSKKNRQHNGVVCSFLIYGFVLPLWYLLAIVLSVLLRCTDSDYPFGIFWPLKIPKG